MLIYTPLKYMCLEHRSGKYPKNVIHHIESLQGCTEVRLNFYI